MTVPIDKQCLALIPSKIVETLSEMAEYNWKTWRAELLDAATTIVNGEPDCYGSFETKFWDAESHRWSAVELDEQVESIKRFAVEVWPNLDVRTQEFVAHLYWTLNAELTDSSD